MSQTDQSSQSIQSSQSSNTQTASNNETNTVEQNEEPNYSLHVIKNQIDQLQTALVDYIEMPQQDWRESDTKELAVLCQNVGNNFRHTVLRWNDCENALDDDIANNQVSIVKVKAPQEVLVELQKINSELKELKQNIIKSMQEREKVENMRE